MPYSVIAVEQGRTRWRAIRATSLQRKGRLRVSVQGQWSKLEPELAFLDDYLRPRT